MLKKRIIFTLLYDNGNYMLSRNFRLQNVGNLNWLKENYVFSKISFSIDELLVLNVSRENIGQDLFMDHIKELTKECFIPIAAGGGIKKLDDAKLLFKSGADKVVINSAINENPNLIKKIARAYGSQSIIASIDVKFENNNFIVYTNGGTKKLEKVLNQYINYVTGLPIGEIYLNSIDKDGTGQGYFFEILKEIPDKIKVPVILAGGVGNYIHFDEGLNYSKIDAVATAHLFNFIGEGLKISRHKLINKGHKLPTWKVDKLFNLKNALYN